MQQQVIKTDFDTQKWDVPLTSMQRWLWNKAVDIEKSDYEGLKLINIIHRVQDFDEHVNE